MSPGLRPASASPSTEEALTAIVIAAPVHEARIVVITCCNDHRRTRSDAIMVMV
ncbi:MAG: hypothetical protein JWO19_5990, partial [Bryobacterales bacterium]|nr:hypothetical protein [Bryobacterales bacterium]